MRTPPRAAAAIETQKMLDGRLQRAIVPVRSGMPAS